MNRVTLLCLIASVGLIILHAYLVMWLNNIHSWAIFRTLALFISYPNYNFLLYFRLMILPITEIPKSRRLANHENGCVMIVTFQYCLVFKIPASDAATIRWNVKIYYDFCCAKKNVVYFSSRFSLLLLFHSFADSLGFCVQFPQTISFHVIHICMTESGHVFWPWRWSIDEVGGKRRHQFICRATESNERKKNGRERRTGCLFTRIHVHGWKRDAYTRKISILYCK